MNSCIHHILLLLYKFILNCVVLGYAMHCLLTTISVCLSCAVHSKREEKSRAKQVSLITTSTSGSLLTNNNNNNTSTSESLFCFHFVSFVSHEPSRAVHCAAVLCVVCLLVEKMSANTYRLYTFYKGGLSRADILGHSLNRSAGKVGTPNASLININKHTFKVWKNKK